MQNTRQITTTPHCQNFRWKTHYLLAEKLILARMDKHTSQIEKMHHLMNYGMDRIEESTNYNRPEIAWREKGADGKTYAVAHCGNKYYVMEAQKKETAILAEDFDYIGGFNNRKRYEYGSYNKAFNALTMKLKSISEAYRVTPKPVIKEESDWQTENTVEMREDINRFQRIMNNAESIMHENKTDFTTEHTLPEAPAQNPSDKDKQSPFIDAATAEGDKDFTVTETDPTEASSPFDLDPDKSVSGEETFSEKPKYGPDNNVAAENPSGGKVTRADESTHHGFKHRVVISEAQKAAYRKALMEAENAHNGNNQNIPTPGTGTAEKEAPFEQNVNEAEIDVNNVAGLPDESNNEMPEDLPFPEIGLDQNPEGMSDDFDMNYEDWMNSDDDTQPLSDDDLAFMDNNEPNPVDNNLPMENARPRGTRLSEVHINDFGKHPSYQKEPMSTPANTEPAINGAREWDDKSAQGNSPYGQKIGSGAPFENEDELVKTITDKVMETLFRGKA